MDAAAIMLIALGKWRYLITGAAFAVLFGLLCRACGRLLSPLQSRRTFSGTCTAVIPAEGRNAVAVAFSDRRQLRHTAAFLTDEPVKAGETLRIAIRAEVFAAGAYPKELSRAAEAGEDIVTARAYRKTLRNILLRELLIQCITCGIALAVCAAAVKICFP